MIIEQNVKKLTVNVAPSAPFNLNQAIELQRQNQDQLQNAQMYLQQALSRHPPKLGKLYYFPFALLTLLVEQQQIHQTPNFAKIYTFLGSLFDSNSVNHEEALNEMSPTDRDTIQFLMQNLSISLANQQFKVRDD